MATTNSQPLPEVVIYFDGVTLPADEDHHNAAAGAAAIIRVNEGMANNASHGFHNGDNNSHRNADNVYAVSHRMGTVHSGTGASKACAAYYGLILGLRELLYLFPSVAYNLKIQGDSQLVMDQLNQEYNVAADFVLQNYHHVTGGLLQQIQKHGGNAYRNTKITFQHIPKVQNHRAATLAEKAAHHAQRVTPVRVNHFDRFVQDPFLWSFLKATIVGKQDLFADVSVAHDQGQKPQPGVSGAIFVDATTLREIHGDAALSSIHSAGRKNLLQFNNNHQHNHEDAASHATNTMTVLGTTSLTFSFGKGLITVEDAFVVDFLPWPLQISMHHPALSYDNVPIPSARLPPSSRHESPSSNNSTTADHDEDWKNAVPKRFHSHPYWGGSHTTTLMAVVPSLDQIHRQIDRNKQAAAASASAHSRHLPVQRSHANGSRKRAHKQSNSDHHHTHNTNNTNTNQYSGYDDDSSGPISIAASGVRNPLSGIASTGSNSLKKLFYNTFDVGSHVIVKRGKLPAIIRHKQSDKEFTIEYVHVASGHPTGKFQRDMRSQMMRFPHDGEFPAGAGVCAANTANNAGGTSIGTSPVRTTQRSSTSPNLPPPLPPPDLGGDQDSYSPTLDLTSV